MNILFVGSAGPLSLLPFKALLASTHTLAAVGIYQPLLFKDNIIALENESLALAAQQSAVPVIDLSRPVASVLPQLRELQVDVLLMACYGRRLPKALFDFPAHGSYNLHPSLLPAYRGPEPVYWQLKHGAATGISWHRVSEAFDSGDIIAQKKVYLEDGLSYQQINAQLASAGSELMAGLLSELENGQLQGKNQNPDAASYFPYPQAEDFVLDVRGSARRACNFMCATQEFGQTFSCTIAGREYRLARAMDFDPNRVLECVEVQGECLFIPFKQGVLIATVAGKL